MDSIIKLLDWIRHRYIAHSTICNADASQVREDIKTLIDTGAFNTMIDLSLAERFGIMLPIKIPVSIGGNLGESQGCIIPKLIVARS